MTDLDELLLASARRWAEVAHDPPALEPAVREAIRQRRPVWTVLAAAAVVAIIALAAALIAVHHNGHGGALPTAAHQRLGPAVHTASPSAPPSPRELTVTALPISRKQLGRAWYWANRTIQSYRPAPDGSVLQHPPAIGATWPKNITRVEAVLLSVEDASRLFGSDVSGAATAPPNNDTVLILHIVGTLVTPNWDDHGDGPKYVRLKSMTLEFGSVSGGYAGMSDVNGANSAPIPGATQIKP